MERVENDINRVNQVETCVMTNDKIKIEDKIFSRLYDMEPYKPYEIAKKVSQENIPVFIATVKRFIDADYGRHLGFYIEFDDTYSFIKKKNY